MARYWTNMRRMEYYTAYVEADSAEEAKELFEMGCYDDLEEDYGMPTELEMDCEDVYLDEDNNDSYPACQYFDADGQLIVK